MSIVQPSATPAAYPDRSALLMVCGVFQILLGCFFGLMALMMVGVSVMMPVAAMPQGAAMSARMVIPAVALYLGLAVIAVCLGVGSFLGRRWAWTLTVVLSWMWLVVGALAFVFYMLFASPMKSAMAQPQVQMPPATGPIIQFLVGIVVACIYILLPALFLAVYQREAVRATCRRLDPKIRWTDRSPMPVLALAIFHGWSALYMPSMLAYGGVMPVFGRVLTGASGVAVILAMMLAMAFLAWGTYRLRMAAWWGTVLLWTLGILNMLTISERGLTEMYEKMQLPAAQLDMIRKSGMVDTMARSMPWMGLVFGVAWLGCLLYVRRYFVHADEPFEGND